MRFLLVFVVLQLLLFGANMLAVVQQELVLPWTAQLARACVALLVWFDSSVAAQGKVVWNMATGFGISIEPGCNGIEACILLLAAIVAFPARWRDKATGFVAGALTVQVLNIVRVVSLFYLGQWHTGLFQFAHAYLWQILIMLDVLVFWLCWARWAHGRSGTPSGKLQSVAAHSSA